MDQEQSDIHGANQSPLLKITWPFILRKCQNVKLNSYQGHIFTKMKISQQAKTFKLLKSPHSILIKITPSELFYNQN